MVMVNLSSLLKSYWAAMMTISYKVICENHCLHHLLPIAKSINCALQDVGHARQ